MQKPTYSDYYIVINKGSGSQQQNTREAIETALKEQGARTHWVELEDEQIAQAIKSATAANALVVAAGGDGTVRSVAEACYRARCPMGIIPLGTFNYLARQIGMALDPAKAAAQLLNTERRPMPVGFVNDAIFLNNASLGLYTRVIRNREEVNKKYGRFRVVAIISGIAILIKGMSSFSIRVHDAPTATRQRTALFFACINPLQLKNLGLPETTNSNEISVTTLKGNPRLKTLRLLARGLTKNLGADPDIDNFSTDRFRLETSRKRIDMVIDGEIIPLRAALDFRVEPDALQLAAPREPAA